VYAVPSIVDGLKKVPVVVPLDVRDAVLPYQGGDAIQEVGERVRIGDVQHQLVTGQHRHTRGEDPLGMLVGQA
jgi:hypothetical protein